MRAVVYDAPRSFALQDVPDPVPGPGEVLIRVRQTGLCGTDLHIHEGDFFAEFPLVPGHEVVGVVEALGEGLAEGPEEDGAGGAAGALRLGEQVTVNPNVNCRRCGYCRRGETLRCAALRGLGTNWAGGFAELLVAPVEYVYSTEGLPPDVAVFTEPTACAVHGLETLAARPGSTALIFGAGPTGLLLAQLLARGGAAHVTVAAPTAFKLERARALGVDATLQMDRSDLPGTVAALRESSPDGFDLVVEATGSPEVAEVCVPLTRSGGTVMIYGVTGPDDRVSFSPYDVFRREISIKGSFAEIDAFPAAIAALRSGRASCEGLITHRFALEDYAGALEALRSDKTVHKVVLAP